MLAFVLNKKFWLELDFFFGGGGGGGGIFMVQYPSCILNKQ